MSDGTAGQNMLTIEELASALRVSTRQVQRLQADGLPYTPVGKTAKRYELRACTIWLQEHYKCQSSPTKAGGMSPSASTTKEYTDACRKVQLRVMPAP